MTKYVGTITIKDIHLTCNLGVSSEESQYPQKISVSCEIKADYSRCMLSDDMNDGIDYSEVEDLIRSITTKKSYSLIEHLAKELVDGISSAHSCTEVLVTIAKPNALAHAEAAQFTLVATQ